MTRICLFEKSACDKQKDLNQSFEIDSRPHPSLVLRNRLGEAHIFRVCITACSEAGLLTLRSMRLCFSQNERNQPGSVGIF
jgi:hypothetical protein